MPFDLDGPQHRIETPRDRLNRRLAAAWLFTVCAMLWVMIVLGGATRLTGSGLSIMEWAPLSGALPPWSEAEWNRLFALYRQIPQYELVNHGFGLDGFKHIFWLEWTHRLWGRLIGIVFLVPLVVLGVLGAIPRGLWLRLGGLFVLGGLQGAVGWFMVASGFAADSTAVSAYRLVAHLSLALLLYGAILWTALGVLRPGGRRRARRAALDWLLAAIGVVLPLTIVAGGFVAGLHAGMVYNTFPLMGGGIVPPDYAPLHPFARNLTENLATVQFDHRVLATLTAVLVAAAAILGMRRRQFRDLRLAALCMGLAVAAQYGLGVATLLWVVPAGSGDGAPGGRRAAADGHAGHHPPAAASAVTAGGRHSRLGAHAPSVAEGAAAAQPWAVAAETPEQIKSGAQARFLATMSHELRTPLNVVIGFSDAMMRDSGGRLTREQSVEYAASINEAGRQLLTLVDVILDVARVEAGQLDLPSDLMDIAHVIGTVVAQCSDSADAADLSLKADTPAGLPFARGDERRLRQALAHMVGNAIKFTPPGGSVLVSARLDERGDMLVLVTDTGIGIAGCDLQRAFEPFVQLDGSLARRFPGSGLGLYVSRITARAHGGDLILSSTPGVGTTAALRLPADRLAVSPSISQP